MGETVPVSQIDPLNLEQFALLGSNDRLVCNQALLDILKNAKQRTSQFSYLRGGGWDIALAIRKARSVTFYVQDIHDDTARYEKGIFWRAVVLFASNNHSRLVATTDNGDDMEAFGRAVARLPDHQAAYYKITADQAGQPLAERLSG